MDIVRDYFNELTDTLNNIDIIKINDFAEELLNAYNKEKSIFVIGNGGSASTASHFACDLGKGTLGKEYNSNKKRFKVHSLTDNVSLLTAYGNDLNFESIFEQQLRNQLNKDDILFSMTVSGTSPDIIKALEYAKNKGAYTISLLGFDGGDALELSDKYILIKNRNYGIVEDAHAAICHTVSQSLEKRLKDID